MVVCGHEWKETCFYINAAHTQLWQLLSLFLKSTLAQDVNRPFWAMKIAIFGLEGTLKQRHVGLKLEFRHVELCLYFFIFFRAPCYDLSLGCNLSFLGA